MYISILSLYILSQIIIRKEITIFVRNEKQVESSDVDLCKGRIIARISVKNFTLNLRLFKFQMHMWKYTRYLESFENRDVDFHEAEIIVPGIENNN